MEKRALQSDMSSSARLALQVTHIVGSLEFKSAGPSYSVPALASGLARIGASVELLTIGSPSRTVEGGVETIRFRHDFSLVPGISQLRLSSELHAAIEASAARGGTLHAHGLWQMPNIYPLLQAKKHCVPVLLTPRGMLADAALKFSRWKKELFSVAIQRRALENISCFHATCDAELQEIRAYGLKAPVAIIPNGVDMPPMNARTGSDNRTERTLLYLGRLHPKKGADALLMAWSRLEAAYPDWRLEFIGPSEIGYRDKLKKLAGALNLQRVSFQDPVYGQEKLSAFRRADLFVLPSLNENFGMTVSEALAAGTPVVSTRGTPWGGLVEQGCGWWIDQGIDPLCAALANGMAMPQDERVAMGERGRAWMQRDFSWDHVAVQMADVYAWLRGNGPRPGFVDVMPNLRSPRYWPLIRSEDD
ncbi:glycosyltransferase [uncultured Rhodoblastus sp.]|uniref:glycosyltransferase n=1 Tax=uncultured Rhodoblastus sp. TaxID=543037 RepID=UPI0025E02748|nr:glycosyltransferase [uncultured Rhodoblastus sp.]